MARGTQLTELIAQLRAETGRSQKVSVGVDEVENLKSMLRRVQETLYDDYEWPHLNVQRDINLSSGQRYYDLPSDLNFDRIDSIKLKYNNIYTCLERGIEFDDYSIFDSNNDERSSPTLKWDIRYTTSTEQLEFWPIPNRADKIFFFGTKALSPLVDETDRADLDDRVIVLFAAAEILARQKSSDANAKLELAKARLITIRRNSKTNSKMIQVGLGNRNNVRRSNTVVIVS